MSREANDATECAADLIEMGDEVSIIRSGEVGNVDGFKAIGGNEPEFWVEYVDATGCARSAWFRATELEPTNPPPAVEAAANVIPFPR